MRGFKITKIQNIILPVIVVSVVFYFGIDRNTETIESPDPEIPGKVIMIGNPAESGLLPGWDNKQVDEATRTFQQGDMQQAERIYQEQIVSDPNDYKAYHGLGSVFAHEKKYKDAEQAFEKALEINPEFSASYMGLGTIALTSGNPERARTMFDKVIKLEPNFGPGYWSLGLVYYYQHKCDLAKQNFQKVIEYMPGFPQAKEAHKLIANCESNNGKTKNY
jgi:tetratricopeptide (TPR) repeat protein